MQYISEIRATGIDENDNTVQWVVATYLDHQAASKHHELCHVYLARANDELPKSLTAIERTQALQALQPAHDVQYAQLKARDVTYSLDAHIITTAAPVDDKSSPWRSVLFNDKEIIDHANYMARRYMRDEEQEGAPEGALPAQSSAEQTLWTMGINPALPVLDCAKDTCGTLYYGRFADAVEDRRRILRVRSGAYMPH